MIGDPATGHRLLFIEVPEPKAIKNPHRLNGARRPGGQRVLHPAQRRRTGYVRRVIKGFSHMQLVVSDIDVTIEWYGKVLGMEAFQRGSFSGGDYAALRSPTGRFVIGLQTPPTDGTAVPPPAMIDHLSFAVEDRDDLERHRDAIVAAGVDSGPLIEEAASWNFRFRDPDGLLVELTAPK